MAGLDPRHGRRRQRGEGLLVRLGLLRELAVHQAHDAFDHPHEALTARVHDPGFPQDGQQLRRALQRGLGARQRVAQHAADVVVGLGVRFGAVRRFAAHREDGALDRILERGVQALEAPPQRRRQLARPDADPRADALVESDQEVRQHHAGVAARAHDGGLGRGARHVRQRRVAEPVHGLGDGPHGEPEVGPRVAVRHREHVQAVQLLASRGHPAGGRHQRAPQPGAVQVRDCDGHRITP